MWSLNTKEGYLANFEIYQGKRFSGNVNYERQFGKAAAPFVSMLDSLPQAKLLYKFCMDNLFLRIYLFHFLREKGYSVTGTFRDNRLPKNCPLKSNHELKSAPRGTQDAYIAKDYVIMFVRWVDNNVVTIGSTAYGVSPSTSVKRYSQAEKRVIQVPRPCLLGQYYKYIDGTDQMDQNPAIG
ncbi:hypothetical protein ILUMI_16924 [Ignelater luminosus]|uniref:PiggyBac transposable element-derived protein domain-containing protein n=1 Tax=Ignelater luminosus TaxID=2038154 RepID=A0A8K0CMN9_IGNLU|nr:hypothetical protein ILUMI_16924 [Ignelater luminosus]